MSKIKKPKKEFADGTFRMISSQPTTFARGCQLDEEQKEAKRLALENTVMFLTGKPGTSKTFLATQIALDGVISKQYSKVIISRPTVNTGESKDMGFLPGDAFDFKEGKMAPYIKPVLQQMYKLKDKKTIDDMIEKGLIEIQPLQFIRGLNFEDTVVVIDEGQNATVEELKAIVTRICQDAKVIITSDYNQIDLRNKNKSLANFVDAISKLKGVATYNLTKNYRHPLALEILDLVNEMEEKEDERKAILYPNRGEEKTTSDSKDIRD